MIGLKKNTVQVVEHDPDWTMLAADACQEVRLVAELITDIQHVGSTAVPGLPAKPIIDLVASVATSDAIPELVEKLSIIGYIYRGDAGDSGGHLFVMDILPNVRMIHLHVVEHNDIQWKNYLCFRDLLMQNSYIRKQYAELKQQLGIKFPDDRESYTASKHEFIQEILKITTRSEERT